MVSPIRGRLGGGEESQLLTKTASEQTLPVTVEPDQTDILTVVRQTVAAKIELPLDAVGAQDRLLSDLHINSIAVTQIVAAAARRLGIATPMAPTEFATLTVADVAQSLTEIAQQGDQAHIEYLPTGVASWVRSFTVAWVARPRPQRQVRKGKAWQVITAADYPLTAAMQSAFAAAGGGGIVLCLPPTTDETQVGLLLQATRQVLAETEQPRFVVVQHTDFHALNAWLCWVPNLIFVEWLIRRGRSRLTTPQPVQATGAADQGRQ